MLAHRAAIAFCAALCLWYPSGTAFVHSNLDLVTTAIRFLLALSVSWIGVTVLAMVVAGYGTPATPDAGDEHPRRRASDPLETEPSAEGIIASID